MSQYDSVWAAIKHVGSATVTVSKGHARTVEDGVKRVKTAENTARTRVGLVGWSKLVITRKEISSTHVRITFDLLYRTDL